MPYKYNPTAGMASAYQARGGTSQVELSRNISTTAGDFIRVIVAPEEVIPGLREAEVVSVKIRPEYDQLALYFLARFASVRSLPNGVYVIRRADLRFLEEAGIPYTIIESA